jgi:hypothetical protein
MQVEASDLAIVSWLIPFGLRLFMASFVLIAFIKLDKQPTIIVIAWWLVRP